jgi:scyllo-inositol 2-dehydrogenase (NADP+)
MLSVFHNRRHDGDYMVIRDIIDRGIIGDVYHVEISGTGWGNPGTWWRADKAISGGAMYDWGAHFMDWVLNFVPSKVAGVNGYFHKRVWMDATNEDQTQAIVRFENGCVCDIQLGNIDMAPRRRWRILGTKGAIVDGERERNITVHVLHEGMRAVMHVPYKSDDWQAYYNNIAAHLKDGAELEVKPEEARRVIAIFQAAEKSSKSGKTEKPDYV